MESKKFNFNSFLVLLLMAGAAVLGWFGQTTLTDIKDNLRSIRADIMPRHEIELQISAIREAQSAIREQQTHCDTRILEIQTKVISIEMEMARRSTK